MALPEEGLPCDYQELADESGEDNGRTSSVQVENSQYQEPGDALSNSAVAHDEEAVGEIQLDSKGPGSKSVVENTSLNAHPTVFCPDSKLLVRPKSAGDGHVEQEFTFAKASRPQMDFLGTRKGPVSSMPSDTELFTEEDSPDQVGGTTVALAAAEDQRSRVLVESVEPKGTTPSMTVENEEHIRPADAPKPNKKRKDKKKRRYTTAPEDPIINYSVATTVESMGEAHIREESAENAAGVPTVQTISPQTQQNQLTYFPMDVSTDVPITISPEVEQLVSPQPQQLEKEQHSTYQAQEVAAIHPQSPSAQLHSNMMSDGGAEHRPVPSKQPETTNSDNIQALHQISDRYGGARVSKPRSKRSRRTTSLTFSGNERYPDLSSEINDYMQILQYKINQKQSNDSARFALERSSLQTELEQVMEARQVLHNQLDNATQEKERLEATIDKQKGKVATYETKMRKFKTYVDGLGHDIDALKKDANAYQRQREELQKAGEAYESEREALRAQLNASSEQFNRLQKDTSEALRESQAALERANSRGDYLNQQLSDTVGILAEERDRRSQLQHQLDKHMERQLTSTGLSDQKVLELLNSNKRSVLEKLSEISSALLGDDCRKELSTKLKKTFDVVQALGSKASTTESDIASVKDSIVKFEKSVTQHLRDSSSSRDEAVAISFQSQLEDALSALKDDLSLRQERIQQDAASQEHFRWLEEKLKEYDAKMANASSQISEAQENEKRLKEENEKLQTRVTALQSEGSPARNAQAQLNEVRADLDAKVNALGSAKADLTKRTEDLRNSRASNDSLQEQVRTLEARLKEVPNTTQDFGPEREELQREARAEVERVRKEMVEHTEKFETELTAETANKLKRLTGERDRLQKQMKPIEDELEASKTRIQELEERSTGAATKDQELEKLKNFVMTQKGEIKSLQVTLDEHRNAAKGDASLRDKHSALSVQFESQRKKLLQAEEKYSTVSTQNKGLQTAANQAKLARDQTKSEYDEYRADTEKTLKARENELAEAKEAEERSAAGFQLHKESFQKEFDDQASKKERQIKDLQERVSQAQGEAQRHKEEKEKLRAENEQQWEAEERRYQAALAESRQEVAQAKSQRDEALQRFEPLRQEQERAMEEQRRILGEQLDEAKQRAIAAENQLKSQQQPPNPSSTISSRLRVPSVREGITPTGSLASVPPTRPRKKVNHRHNSTIEDNPVPVPEELRPESQRTDSAKGKEKIRGPVVEDSQLLPDRYTSAIAADGEAAAAARSPSMLLPNSDDLLDPFDNGSRLEETQSQEGLPSFAEFHSNLATSVEMPGSKAIPQFLSTASMNANDPVYTGDKDLLQGHIDRNVDQHLRARAGQSIHQPAQDSFIYEDSQEHDELAREGKSERNNARQDSLLWGQEELEKYAFNKPFARPNSAAKRTHRDLASGSVRRQSATQHEEVARKRVAAASEVTGQTTKVSSGRMNSAASSKGSSSTAFIPNGSDRKLKTYKTSGVHGSKRRSSRTETGSVLDPRVAARNATAAPKRKADGHIVEGYEQERKKRLNAGSTRVSANVSGLNPQVRAQPVVNSPPSSHTMRAGPGSSQNWPAASMSQSSMRTPRRRSSRTIKGAKKMPKDEEFNARFSKELGGR